MDEQKYVETKSLQSGMRTKKHVVDGEGRTIVPNGTILDDFMIKNLPRLGVTGAYICTDEEDEPENLSFFEDVVSEEVQEIIEKHYIPDEAKVSLSESVKERVCQWVTGFSKAAMIRVAMGSSSSRWMVRRSSRAP